MRAATYRRQLRLWHEAEERLDALANARLGGLLSRIAVSSARRRRGQPLPKPPAALPGRALKPC